MGKGKIILAMLVIVSYILTVAGWLFDSEILFFTAFGICSVFLLAFIIVALKKPKISDEAVDEEISTIPYIEEDEYNENVYNENPNFENEEAFYNDMTGADNSVVNMERAEDSGQIAEYMAKIDELNYELEEMRAAYGETRAEYEAARNELEGYKKREAAEKNMAMSILPDSMKSREELSTINIVDIAKSVVNELHTAALRAGLRVQVSSGEENIYVRADENLLRVLFRNIVDNSIKYMNRQGMLVITLSTIGDDLFVVLKDNGEGLAAEETGHIFELNYQGSNRISGNGLGLAQAKAVVEYYGGNIYAKSTKGGGMGIYIQLPTS